MNATREIIASGLAQRAEAGIKVRQPLPEMTYWRTKPLSSELESLIKDEVNVKVVTSEKGVETDQSGFKQEPSAFAASVLTTKVELDTKLTPELRSEGIMRELVRFIQNGRKKAGLNVDDRIKLRLETGSTDVKQAIKKFKDTIFTETLATGDLRGEGDYSETVKVEDQEVKIYFGKAID